jgi:hypothetical protein
MGTNRPPSVLPTSSWDLETNWRDEIVEEIHAYREEYAAGFDYDLERMFEDIKAKEAKNPAPRAKLRPVRPRTKG